MEDVENELELSETENIIGITLLIGLLASGLVGNVLVLKGSKRVTMFSKRNAYLFFGLALSDLFVCLLRAPSLLFIRFHGDTGNVDVVCGIWACSHVFVFIAVITNAALAIERRMIIVSFQRYLSIFTPAKILLASVTMWCLFTVLAVSVYIGTNQQSHFDEYLQTCSLAYVEDTGIYSVINITNSVFVCVFGFIPITIISHSYCTIVLRIVRTGLLNLDGLVEQELYSRLVSVSMVRVLLFLVTWTPFFIFVVFYPIMPISLWYIRCAQFADYLVLAQSSISPFITLHDTDFRQTLASRRWRFCSTLKSRSSQRFSSRHVNTRGSHNRAYVTSADFRTSPQTE